MNKRYRCGIMATVCVPWDEDFSFNEGLFRWQTRHLISQGIHDVYVFGTAGEGHAVTEKQFDEITAAFLQETEVHDVQPLIGIISMSLPTVIERIERAIDMGATRFQISLPSWAALNDRELETFFDETCGRFPRCEFMHYNLLRSRRLLTPEEYAHLAERHPNLVATKNSSIDVTFLNGLLTKAPQLQHFITEPGFADAAMVGECGLLLSIFSIKPELARRYFDAGRQQDAQTLRAMQAEAKALVADLLHSVDGAAHIDGAFDKMFCRVHDARFPLRLLPPFAAASETAFTSFQDAIRTKHPRWALE